MKWRSLEEAVPNTDVRTLRDIYAERKELIARYAPPETQAIHARVVGELREQGISDRALAAGTKAPVFELTNHNGTVVSSAALLAKKPLVICFFRGRWCPFCVGQLQAMNQVMPQIEQAGAAFVGISPQTVKQSFFMADQHKLGFPLLSDAGNHLAGKFGLVYRVPDDQRNLYQRTFVNLPFTNGNDSWELPVPATFIVGTDGTILYASANPDYTERPEPAEIVKVISSRQ